MARKERRYEIPSDVSDDFKLHFRAWRQTEYRVPATNQMELKWKKVTERAPNHLYMCASYLALWAEMAGATGIEDIHHSTPPEPEQAR